MRYCCGVFRWRRSLQLQFYCEGSIAQLISMERETIAVEWGLAALASEYMRICREENEQG